MCDVKNHDVYIADEFVRLYQFLDVQAAREAPIMLFAVIMCKKLNMKYHLNVGLVLINLLF